jgi:cell division protein FtsW
MKPRRKVPDFVLFVVILVLLTIGIIIVYSSSYIYAQTTYHDGAYYLKRQLLWALLGIVGMVVTMRIDYRNYQKWANTLFLISLALLILVMIPGVGTGAKGATRWINLGFTNLQPSELAKLTMVIFLAKNLSSMQNRIRDFLHGVLPQLLIIGLVCGLVLIQPDLGTAVTIAGTAFLMLMAAGAKRSHLVGLATLGVGLVGAAIRLKGYRMKRMLAFIDPWADPGGAGFQTIQSLYAVGSGRLFGMGLGQGRQKFLYLPEQHTDFIFAVLSEELGFIGSAFVVMLFFTFMWRGLKIALKSPDNFGALLAVGITIMVVLQAVINIGVVTGVLPVTGITLPFISYGGTSLTISLVGMGILLNISNYVEE